MSCSVDEAGAAGSVPIEKFDFLEWAKFLIGKKGLPDSDDAEEDRKEKEEEDDDDEDDDDDDDAEFAGGPLICLNIFSLEDFK